MSTTPELVIPIRMDPSKATAALKQVGSAGQKAGDEVAGGMDKAEKKTKDFGGELLALQKGRMAMDAVLGVASAIGDSLKRTADHARATAKEFIEIQRAMQSIAAISGKPNVNEFTRTEVAAARAANRTPEQWTAFRTAFMAKASNYVGDKPGAILDTKESALLQSSMAEFAAGKGSTDQEMADIVGGILAQEKGPTTAKALMARIGKAWGQLEAASKDPSKLAAGLTEQMAMGMTLEEAAPKLAAMPEIAPGQESAYLKGTLSHLEMARSEGKLEKFGVTEEMSPAQMLEKTVEAIGKEAGTGADRQKRIGDLIRENVTKYQESVQTLKGFINKGPESMQMWKDIGAKIPENAVQKAIEEDRRSDAGRQRHIEAEAGAARAERGLRNVEVERLRQQAHAELEREGRFEEAGPAAVARDLALQAAGKLTGKTVEESLTDERAVEIARKRAGLKPGEGPVSMMAGGMESSKVVEAALKKLVEYEEQKRQRQQAPPPLSAPPPQYWDVRM